MAKIDNKFGFQLALKPTVLPQHTFVSLRACCKMISDLSKEFVVAVGSSLKTFHPVCDSMCSYLILAAVKAPVVVLEKHYHLPIVLDHCLVFPPVQQIVSRVCVLCVCVLACVCVYMCLCACVCTCVYTHTRVCACTCVCMCACVCVYVHVCVCHMYKARLIHGQYNYRDYNNYSDIILYSELQCI